jgi:hypothetical protein
MSTKNDQRAVLEIYETSEDEDTLRKAPARRDLPLWRSERRCQTRRSGIEPIGEGRQTS